MDSARPQLKQCVIDTFKAIYNSTNTSKEESKISAVHNMTISEKNLKTYLSRRYSQSGSNKLVNKVCCLFSWTAAGSTKLDYKHFYEQLDQVIMNSGTSYTAHIQDYSSHIISLKQIAFNIYDMNCDHRICEYDLFSIIKSTNNKLFIDTINQDFIDIRAKMASKEIDNLAFDINKSIDNETMEIKDLKRWLSERESKYTI